MFCLGFFKTITFFKKKLENLDFAGLDDQSMKIRLKMDTLSPGQT